MSDGNLNTAKAIVRCLEDGRIEDALHLAAELEYALSQAVEDAAAQHHSEQPREEGEG